MGRLLQRRGDAEPPQRLPGSMKLNRPLQNQMQMQRRRAEMLTPEQAGAQPFDAALRPLRMNRAAARFTSNASTKSN